MVVHTCNRCKTEFNKKSNFLVHINKKKQCQIKPIDIVENIEDIEKTAKNCENNVNNEELTAKNRNFSCNYCLQTFARNYNLKIHIDLRCKIKKQKDKDENKLLQKIEDLEKEINILKSSKKVDKPKKNIVVEKLDIINDNINKITKPSQINEKLINMVIQKENQLEVLQPKNTKKNLVNIIGDEINNEDYNEIIKPVSLILNGVVIVSRSEDYYINATQLCQAGGKKFSHWISLDNTKELIKVLESDAGIPASQLIDIKKGKSNNFNQGSWIHPDLAGQLAQWISPNFALQVSKWIRSLFTNGSIDIKALKDKDIELKTKDKKIKVLENLCVKKHKREEYPEKNVIYMLSTEEHKKNRIYIIGKAKNLKERLGPYNKTCDHEVIYYKECKSEEDMKVIEEMVLLKLDKYKEVANRDRFVLPIDNDISLFKKEIDKAVYYFN
jgi:hypothetical protein